jgi:hypothetical protein
VFESKVGGMKGFRVTEFGELGIIIGGIIKA